MVELRYCLNMVTRQEQFTSTNAFHSGNLLIFFSFSHVFTIVELRHLINRPRFELEGFHSKCPSAFRSTVFQWWQDELFKSTDNTRVLLFTLRPTQQKRFFLKNPSKYFGGDNDCPSRKPCTRYDVTSDIRSNQISRSTARRVFGTVYLKMSQKIVTKQKKRKKSFVSITV